MENKYETRGVLGGAYRGKREDLRARLTHTVLVASNGGAVDEVVLCRRVRADNMADRFAYTPAQLAARPTCGECLRRDPRFR